MSEALALEWLFSSSAGALRHDIKQLSVGLTQQLIKDAAVDVISIFAGHVRGQRLIDASGRHIYQSFCAFDNLNDLYEG